MPELAEVEFYRKRWDPGIGVPIRRVAVHGEKRLFRGSDVPQMEKALHGARLLGSETRGKQMLMRFSKGAWLGIHLGMTGELRVEPAEYAPGKHDHLVLFQKERALVLEDARMFGRVRFHLGKSAPPWWKALPPAVTAADFTVAYLRQVLQRRARLPLKGLLLRQEIFLGVGNWMADEILWQAKLHPRTLAGSLPLPAVRLLWRTARKVCRVALKTIGVDWGDPPRGWLLHERFKSRGCCPRHHISLERATIAGRTTAWCAKCQKFPKPRPA